MPVKVIRLVALTFLVACGLPLLMLRKGAEPDSGKPLLSTGRGDVGTLEANYQSWKAQYLQNGGDRNLVLSMGWSKGLSTEYTDAYGQARLNLVDRTVSVEVGGLAADNDWDVWLIDNRPGPGRTIMPEPGDAMLNLGRLRSEGAVAKLETSVDRDTFAKNEWEIVAVTRAGRSPSEERVLIGMTTFFHRLYRSEQRGQFGVLSDRPAPEVAAKPRAWNRLLESLIPRAEAQMGPNPNATTPLQQMIQRGRNSFLNQTFSGNGRTCATCHREDNNFTIDPAFIATLPANDPLFVAQFIPALANLENPALMRQLGLILENVDGFDKPGVMRGVPHTLALLQNTLAPVTPTPVFPGGDGTTTPPNERTGWGGDGAPGNGTLRDFMVGAITQHYPKTLARIVNVDFRLPQPDELDDLEAFQKSLGRRADLVLSGTGALRLKSPIAVQGQAIFLNGGAGFPGGPPGLPPGSATIGAGKCGFCHFNAGASDFFFPGQNANFNTNVEALTPHPGAPDGGFGRTGISPTGGIGNGTFNSTVLVEAADTGPFFHNDSVATIEEAVNFYNSAAFNQLPGFGALIGGITLTTTDVNRVAGFLRTINALENIRSSVDLGQRAVGQAFATAQELLKLSRSELDDGIAVLNAPVFNVDASSISARTRLTVARGLINAAAANSFQPVRDALVNQAISLQNDARRDLSN